MNTERLLVLEGLRGIAAVGVVIFHSLSMFYPIMLYGVDSGLGLIQHSRFEDNLYGNPISVIVSGSFAVAIFFVLSGFVLTIGYFTSGIQQKIKNIAAKRYLRLMLPALGSVLVTLLVLAAGLRWIKDDVAGITGSIWLKNIWPSDPSLLSAFNHGTWEVFFTDINAYISYNPVLWTMRYELIGSLIVFAIALLFGKAKHRWVIYVIAIVGLFQTWYLAFVIGMILADLYANKIYPFHDQSKKYGWFILMLVLGVFLGGFPYTPVADSVYETLKIDSLGSAQNHSLFLSVGASFVLIGSIRLGALSRFLKSKYVRLLGRYSFSIYLMHMVVIFTAGAGVFLFIHTHVPFHAAALIATIASLTVLAPVAFLFERFIDAPSIRLSSRFALWLFGGKDHS